MNVQSRLSAYIRKMGITQKSICQKTGIRPDTMSKLLHNKKKMTADEFELICFAIEKEPNDFILIDRSCGE